jgi:hypothetical protein
MSGRRGDEASASADDEMMGSNGSCLFADFKESKSNV